MAREQRQDVDYFPHECTHGRKMHIIESKYGNDGYALWFKLLEQLGKANNHFIDVSDEMTLMFLVSVFKIDEEKTILILNDLAKFEAIDKYLFEEFKVIYSHKFVESIKDAYRNRKGTLKQYNVILNDLIEKRSQSSARLSDINTNLTEVMHKVKENKGEERKEKENKQKDIKQKFNFREKLIDYGFEENLVNDWMLIRKNKKATDTETTFNKFIREVSLAPEDKNEILEFIVGKEWRSFEYQWLLNLQADFKQQQDKNNGKATNNKTREYVASDTIKQKIAERIFGKELS